MHTDAIKLIRDWRALMLLALVPALTNCSKIEGSAELNNSSGAPYSFAGAKVEVFDLNTTAVLVGQTKIPKGIGTVEDDGSTIALQVLTAAITDDALYDVEIRCAANNTTDACDVESPLHVVLSGTQLMAGDWKATALSEAIFHNIAYYVAVSYPVADITQMLDNYAVALLVTETPGSAQTYNDVLGWDPTLTGSLKRPGLVTNLSESLAGGLSSNDLKLLARQSVNPYVASEWLPNFSENSKFLDIVTAGDYAYIVGSDVGLAIVDIHDPERPRLAGRSFAVAGSRKLTVSGDFAYVMDRGAVTIINISNPEQPGWAGRLYLSPGETINDVAVAGGYAYAATHTGLQVFDVSNPAAATVVARLPRPQPVHKVFVFGADVFLTDNAGIHMVDVGDPLAPVYLWSSLPRPSITSPLVAMSDDYVYYSTSAGLFIIDIRNRTTPRLAGQLAMNLLGAQKLELAGTKLYIPASGWAQVVDVSNPTQPAWAGHLGTPGFGMSLAVAGEFAYLTTDDTTLSTIDLNAAVQPLTQSANLRISGVAQDQFTPSGDYAYLRMLGATFSIFDLSNPLAPTLASHFNDRQHIASVVADGNYAFMADTLYQAIQVADVSDPTRPVLLKVNVPINNGSYVNGGVGIRRMALDSERIFLPWGHSDDRGETGCVNPGVGGVGGLFTVDISVPAAPQIAGHVCVAEEAEAVTVSENRAYVSLANRLLQVVDVSNLAQPTLAGNLQLSSVAKSVAVKDNHVWAAEADNGVEIIDVSDTSAPQLKAGIDTPGQAMDIAFDQHYAYVADGASGLLIFDIANPATPLLVASASTRGTAMSVFLIDDYLYAGTTHGIEVFRAMPQLSN